jgi:hypothetical protein
LYPATPAAPPAPKKISGAAHPATNIQHANNAIILFPCISSLPDSIKSCFHPSFNALLKRCQPHISSPGHQQDIIPAVGGIAIGRSRRRRDLRFAANTLLVTRNFAESPTETNLPPASVI